MRIQTKIFLFFCMVCVLMTMGCTSQNAPQNSSGSSGTNTPVITLIQHPCPPAAGNATPYIIIKPISNHTVGDIFEINGTTNLGVDSKNVLNLHEQIVSSLPFDYYPISGTFGCVTIQKNQCSPNSWSYFINLSGYHPQKYWVQVWVQPELNETSLEGFNETSFFVSRNQLLSARGEIL